MIGTSTEITARTRAELALREGEARQAFMLELSDALRPLDTPANIALEAAARLGKWLGLSRVFYGEIAGTKMTVECDYTDGVKSLVGTHDMTAFGDFLLNYRADALIVSENTQADTRYGEDARAGLLDRKVVAFCDIGLFETDDWVSLMCAQSDRPRQWTAVERGIVREVGGRVKLAIERARAEAALRESEARFRLMADAVPSIVWVTDGDGRIEFFNKQWFEYTGAGLKPASAAKVSDDYLHPDDAAATMAAFNEARRTGATYLVEHRIRSKGGDYRWFLVRGEPQRDPATGEIVRWFGASVDIHDRKHAETALRESEQRLRTALDIAALGTFHWWPETKRLELDARSRAIFNLPRDSILTDGEVFGAMAPEDLPRVQEATLDSVANGRRLEINYEIVLPDGSRRSVESIGVPTETAGGRTTRMSGTFLDVTERYNQERQLRESEARFRQFSDASTNVLWIRDAETLELIFASPAFDRVYGIPGPDRGGNGYLRNWARLIEPESRKAVFANFRRVQAGEQVEHEFRIRHATNGALRWIHNTDFPLRDAAGVVRWVAGVGADITDAREATDRQGVLVAELQHRTRNLIAVVRSLSDRTLGNAASLDDFGKRFRPRLAALSRVQGLLSHLATGEKVTFKELLCAELAAHGANDELASQLTLDGPNDVPLRSATVQTFALALHELATNAVKYGALACVDGHLFVSWRVEPATGNDPPRLHVEWRESGVSMPDVDAPVTGGGYGRELIERALPYQLKAKTTYELGADGVRCTISVPIARGGGGKWRSIE